jgi:hypothetical protein
MTDSTQQAPTEAPDLAEGYPTLDRVLKAIQEWEDVPTTGVRRVEVNLFASGEATFNVWVLGEEEPRGGWLESV